MCQRICAPIKELERISRADYTYQRNLLPEQQKEIKTFLDKEEFLFFPEVILSYKVKFDISIDTLNQSPLQQLESSKKYTSNVDDVSLKIDKIEYKGTKDIRGVERIEVVEFNMPDDILDELIERGEHPFHRIDGNHRLSAAKLTNTEKVKRMQIPFCIILSEELIQEEFKDGVMRKIKVSQNEKFEKMVFHNINTKTIPLTSEENLRVILQDDKNFKDAYIKNKGWDYLAARVLVKELPDNLGQVYPYLGNEFNRQPFTVTKETAKLLFDDKVIDKKKSNVAKIKEAIAVVNKAFGDRQPRLENVDKSIIIAAIYIHINVQSLSSFLNWVIANHIYESEGLLPSSLIKIYSKIDQSKSRQIFISMQFDDKTAPHLKAIKLAIEEVNRDHKLDIKLKEIRIDTFNQGHSYKIDDEILRLIEDSGLLIADISEKNVNVYQELGYIMGLNQGKGLKQENFILIKHNKEGDTDSSVGFNIRPFQQLRFDDTMDLIPKLKEAIEKYYSLN